MTLLVDTHAILWFAENNSLLSPRAMAAIVDPLNDLLMSAASYWEIAIKVGLGKLTLSKPFPAFISSAVAKMSLSVLPISIPHAERLVVLPHHHRDPFDRMLAAQALTEGVAIVSVDASFDPYGVTRIW